MDTIGGLHEQFQKLFGGASAACRAPGRVNLIGEHTDYNDGFVLPACIGFSCWVAIGKRDDDKLIIHSANFNETIEVRIDKTQLRPSRHWSDYPLGVAWALQDSGYVLRGANIYIRGNIPLGAGLSSSAALEVSVGYAILEQLEQKIDRVQLALLCQRAENEFVGARCGIMDQFVCCHGRAGNALLLDCRSLEYQFVPVPDTAQLAICNTMVKHDLGVGEYNVRRAECEEGVRRLTAALPGIRALRDVTLQELEESRNLLTETIYKRCRHVVTENDRVLKATSALREGQIHIFGELMADSHKSLRDDYAVSCPELDLMVDIATKQPGVYGARMTGGGFGGCAISLVSRSDTAEFKRHVAAAYYSATGRHPDIYICDASQGAERVPLSANDTASSLRAEK
jgi:galactokinase